MLADAPRMVDHLDAASVAHGERVQAGLRAARHRRSRSTRRSSAASTTTRTRSSSSRASALEQRPVHDPRRRPLRRPHRAARRSAHARHRLRLRHRAGPAQRATPRACSPRPSRTVDCFVVDTTGGEVATALCPGRCATAGVATDRAFDGRSHEVPDEGGRQDAALGVAVIVGEDEKAAAAPSPSATSTAGEQTTVDLETSSVDHIRKVLEHVTRVHAHAHVRRAARRARGPGRVALCGWVGRRREHGEHLAFIDLRDHTGVVQCVVDGAARPPERVRRPHHRHGPRPARGHDQRRARHRRGRGGRLRGRGALGRAAAAVPDRRARRRRRRDDPAPVPLPRPAPRADAAQPPHPRRP